MAKETKISWTHATFNPWRGCVKVSDGCKHCYAEGWAKRTGKDIWGKDAKREHASESYWRQPLKWNDEAARSGEPFRVFCSSLADVCEDREDLLEPRARLVRLICETQRLTWLLCTKRPENFLRLFGHLWPGRSATWPKNVWAMTTVENNKQTDRISHLLKVPAVILGVSYEPALELVRFGPYLQNLSEPTRGVDWLIVGGESGAGARPFNVDWARYAVEDCRSNGATPFVKQLGAKPITDNANLWDFPEHVKAWGPSRILGAASAQYKLNDPKGGDMQEWPPELQVQEFPKG